MELIYLVVGLGLGFLGSRLTGVVKQPAVSTESEPQQEEPENLGPPQEELKQIQQEEPENLGPPQEELKQIQQEEPENLGPLQEELKQAQLAYQMAKEMSQFKAGFLARTSHELRSPLSSLIGMHQLILNDLCDSPEEAREFVAQANASAMKMVKLLDELVDVSKTEHGTNRLEVCALSLTKVFDDLHLSTYMQAANRNFPLEVIPPEPEIHVLADSRRFQQVLRVLVDSAIAQMHEGSIRVSAAGFPDSKEVRIWIDVQSPNRIWSEPIDLLSKKPESNAQPNETDKVSPGLTLLMAQTLVEVMQGRLELLPTSDDQTKIAAGENVIRLQCSMPLGSPETVEQGLVES
jgi:signal transduction histidine kinase